MPLAYIVPIASLLPVQQTDVVKTIESVLKERNAYGATFYEVGEHAPVADINAGLAKFKDAGADVIVAVGGGSPTDTAKTILYLLQQETGGPYLSQIAIPTTLSAAEYTVSTCTPLRVRAEVRSWDIADPWHGTL